MQYLSLVSLVVKDYDEALAFYVGKLGFILIEDSFVPEQNKRWVVIEPPGAAGQGAKLLLARGVGPEQTSRIGNQTGPVRHFVGPGAVAPVTAVILRSHPQSADLDTHQRCAKAHNPNKKLMIPIQPGRKGRSGEQSPRQYPSVGGGRIADGNTSEKCVQF